MILSLDSSDDISTLLNTFSMSFSRSASGAFISLKRALTTTSSISSVQGRGGKVFDG